MAMFGVRELLNRAKIEIPENAVSYHSSTRPTKIHFIVHRKQDGVHYGFDEVTIPITSEQHLTLYQQGRAGPVIHDIEPIQ
jgi:hypothetical protein